MNEVRHLTMLFITRERTIMEEYKLNTIEQLQHLQRLMFRWAFRSLRRRKGGHYPQHSQGRVLAILELKPEISAKELAYLLAISKQSLAEILTKLENKAYIIKKQATNDRRSIVVSITEAGKEAAALRAKEAIDFASLLDCLQEEELIAFSEYLHRLIEQMENNYPEESDEELRRGRTYFKSQYGKARVDGRIQHRAHPMSHHKKDVKDSEIEKSGNTIE